MIQLRWLRRVVGKQYDPFDKTAFNDETVNVLQYRAQYDSNVYAGMQPPNGYVPRMVWSDWIDVPVVADIPQK